MYGIRDNKQWIGFNGSLVSNVRNALKFETFDEARIRTPEFFCAVRIDDEFFKRSTRDNKKASVKGNAEEDLE